MLNPSISYLAEPNWQPYTSQTKKNIPPSLLRWMSTRQSTSKQFSHIAQYKYTIKLRNNGWQYLHRNELQALALPLSRRYYWLRETDLYCDDKLVMYARAAIDNNSPNKQFFQLRNLAAEPLGKLLHIKPEIPRSNFLLCQLLPKHRLFHSASEKLTKPAQSLWARRSFFYFQEYTLLLTEVMLPGITELTYE